MIWELIDEMFERKKRKGIKFGNRMEGILVNMLLDLNERASIFNL